MTIQGVSVSALDSVSLGRTRRSAWAIGSGLAFSGVTMLIGLVSTPWLLQWLGPDRLGMHRVLLGSFSYFALLALGLDGALLAHLASEIGRGNRSATAQLLKAGFRAYVPVTLLLVLGGVIYSAGVRHIVIVGSLPPEEVVFAAFIMAGNAVWTPFTVFRALAEAQQQGYVVKLLLTFQSVLLTGLLLAAARAGWGLPGQSLALVLAQTPTVVVLAARGLRSYPELRSVSVEPRYRRALWSLSWPTLAVAVSGQAALLSDNIIVGMFLGPVSVTAFFLTQRLASLVQAQLQGLGNATWAALVELHAQEKHGLFRGRLLELTSLVSGLGLATLGPIAVYTEHFMRLWVGPAYFAGFAVSLLASLNAWFWSLSTLWGSPVSGTGHIRRWMPYAVAAATVNLAVSVLATVRLGVVGPLVGTLAGFLLIHSWALPRVLWEVFSLEPRQLLKSAVAPMVWGGPYLGIVWFASRAHTPAGWIGLGAQVAVAMFAGVALWWLLSLSARDRTSWTARLRTMLPS